MAFKTTETFFEWKIPIIKNIIKGRKPMLKRFTVKTQTYSIDWAEAYESIKTYIHNKYEVDLGEQNFQIRVGSDTGVFIKPNSIRFKRTNKPQEDTICPNK